MLEETCFQPVSSPKNPVPREEREGRPGGGVGRMEEEKKKEYVHKRGEGPQSTTEQQKGKREWRERERESRREEADFSNWRTQDAGSLRLVTGGNRNPVSRPRTRHSLPHISLYILLVLLLLLLLLLLCLGFVQLSGPYLDNISARYDLLYNREGRETSLNIS